MLLCMLAVEQTAITLPLLLQVVLINALSTVTPVEKLAFLKERTVSVKTAEHVVLPARLFAQQLVAQSAATETLCVQQPM